jgi:hypothetical protein
MKIHRIDRIPDMFAPDSDWPYASKDLEDYYPGLDGVIPDCVVEVWYWYGTAPYEGVGHIILLDDAGRWYHHDMGHCSCFGPLDKLSLRGDGHASYAELHSTFSDALAEQTMLITTEIALTTLKALRRRILATPSEYRTAPLSVAIKVPDILR